MSFTTTLARQLYCFSCHKSNVSLRLYSPCGHLYHCTECSDVYLQTVGSTWPGLCPLCSSRVLKLFDGNLIGPDTVYYSIPTIGYCTEEHLLNRLFIAPSGISWIYQPQIKVPDTFQLPENHIISIPLNVLPTGNIEWDTAVPRRETPTALTNAVFEANTTRVVRLPDLL